MEWALEADVRFVEGVADEIRLEVICAGIGIHSGGGFEMRLREPRKYAPEEWEMLVTPGKGSYMYFAGGVEISSIAGMLNIRAAGDRAAGAHRSWVLLPVALCDEAIKRVAHLLRGSQAPEPKA